MTALTDLSTQLWIAALVLTHGIHACVSGLCYSSSEPGDMTGAPHFFLGDALILISAGYMRAKFI